MSEEVKYYSKENQRARRRPFLKFFMLNQFKLHPMLDVRQRSRLFTEEGKRVSRTLTNTLLYTAGSWLGGRNRLKSKKDISKT